MTRIPRFSALTACVFFVLAACAGSASPLSQAVGQATVSDNVEAIEARYVEARGGAAALAAITSLTFVSYPDGDVRGRVRTMIKMRPNYFLVGCLQPTCGFAEGLDADGAWDAYPRHNRYRRIGGQMALALERAGEFDDPIINWRAKGHTVTFVGREVIRDEPVQVLLLQRRNDPIQMYYYISVRTGLVAGHRRAVPIHARGEHIDQLTWFTDWRPVAGVLYPHRLTTYDLRPSEEMRVIEGGRGWDAIIANFQYPASFFTPALGEPAPVVAFTMQMYEASATADAAALLAMWSEFRAAPANRAADPEESLNWLGYELLKQERITQALAIFELLVAERPSSANAWDSLGDGYEQAGQTDQAVDAYRHALSLNPELRETRQKLERLTR
jgi:hypothetical protein